MLIKIVEIKVGKRDWKEYNEKLKQRGSILLTFDREFFAELYFSGDRKHGGVRAYSEKMYEYMLTIKVMLKISWRATEGFCEKLIKHVFPEREVYVPNHAHAGRTANKLKLKIKQYLRKDEEPAVIAFDSTGIRVYSSSEWHKRNHKKDEEKPSKFMDKWKKIHISVDVNSMEIKSVVFTDSNVNDCEVVEEIASQIDFSVDSVLCDAAYDTSKTRSIIVDKLKAKDIIPPHITSVTQDKGRNKSQRKEHLKNRDDTINKIRESSDFRTGLKKWKIESGYHKRSKVESTFSRLKKIFGFSLQSKNNNSRLNEVITKINILNLMNSL